MNPGGLLTKLRHLIGDFGWKLYLWSYYGGDEQSFRDEIAEDIGRYERSDRETAWLRS